MGVASALCVLTSDYNYSIPPFFRSKCLALGSEDLSRSIEALESAPAALAMGSSARGGSGGGVGGGDPLHTSLGGGGGRAEGGFRWNRTHPGGGAPPSPPAGRYGALG